MVTKESDCLLINCHYAGKCGVDEVLGKLFVTIDITPIKNINNPAEG